MNNLVFEKAMQNLRQHTDIKFVTVDRRSYLVLESNHHTTKWFSKNLLGIEMNKTEVATNKPVYLGLLILDISKIAVYEY